MNGRDEAGFSNRVWEEIDRATAAVKAANCTARRFLEVDGPYGMGLTSVGGDEVRWVPAGGGAPAVPVGGVGGTPAWGLPPAPPGPAGFAGPLVVGGGTYVVGS